MASKRKASHKKKTTKKITKHKHQKHQKNPSLKSTSVDKLMELLRDASAGLARSKSLQRETHIHKLADIMHRIPVPDSEFSLNVNMPPSSNSGRSGKSNKKGNMTHILSHKHDNRNTKVSKNFAAYYKMESSMSYDNSGKRVMGVETTTNSTDPFVHIKQCNSAKKGNNKVMQVDVPKSSTVIHTNNLH
jgi:hypothetical protein